ncbi:MAG: hypothetical protein ACLQQB_08725 [Solirubrobacteraceae bacterium]|jgi:hypothetical protein
MTTLTTNRRIAPATAAVSVLLASMALALPFGSQAATTAPAPKAPTVSTGGYVKASTSSVTLKGNVNPHGLATVYAFQFGTTTGYGAQTAPVSAGNGTTGIGVSQTITGLPPGVAYHYRLIATNGAGTTNGNDQTFTIKVPIAFALTVGPEPTVFGGPFTVSGVLSGTGATNRAIVLQANPYPYLGGFKNILGPELTDAAGRFSFAVASLTETTQLRIAVVGISPIYSRAVLARVAVRVSLHVRSTGRSGFIRMYGTVTPAVAGAHVAFQLIRRGHEPLTVAGTIVKPAGTSTSQFSRVVRIRRPGLYRAFVHVSNGKQVSGHSRPILIG